MQMNQLGGEEEDVRVHQNDETAADWHDGLDTTRESLVDGARNRDSHRNPTVGLNIYSPTPTCLKTFLVLAAMVIVFLMIALAQKRSHLDKQADDQDSVATGDACLTEECVTLAGHLLESMDFSVDPCEDFYEYSCGLWNAAHPIPEDKARYSTFDKLADENRLLLKTVLEDETMNTHESDDAYKARVFYENCIDTDTLETVGAQPLLDVLASMTALWSPSETTVWDQTAYEGMTEVMVLMDSLDISGFAAAGVGVDDKDSAQHVLFAYQSGLGLGTPEYYEVSEDTETRQIDYKALMESFFALDSAFDGLTVADVAEAVFTFESQLAYAFVPKAQMRDPDSVYNPMSIAELTALNPAIQWETVWLASKYTTAEIASIDFVIVETPSYFNATQAVLAATTPATVNAYFRFHTMLSFASHLDAEFRALSQEYRRVLYGVDSASERWKTCVARTDSLAGFMLGKLYVDAKFSEDSITTATGMIADIKTAFKAHLPELDWMDDETRVAAADKCDSFIDKIGYPDWIYDSDALALYYADLLAEEGDYFGSIQSYRQIEVTKNYAKLFEAVDRNEWSMTPSTVNAYYNPSNNEIVFPAGIMQDPFFKAGFPTAYNYGGLGVVMGHELTHGFDDQGSQYNKDGNLEDWWPEDVREKFEEKVQCIAKQYSSYEFYGVNLNGNLTLGENIADNGGLKEAYQAFKTHEQEFGVDQLLPAVDLTLDQLFFVGFSQVWCGNVREEEAIRRIYTDPHSPGKYRIIGTLSNSDEFAAAFECPAGSPMNPEDKCQVW